MLKFDQDVGSDGGLFVKIESGKSVIGILRGEVKTAWVLWGEDGSKTEVEKGTPGAKFSFKVNFVELDAKTGEMAPKILEQGKMVYRMLQEISEDYNLEETIIKISKTGEKLTTKYSILPLPKKPEAKTLEKIAALDLLPLDGDKGEASSDGSVPF